MSPLGELPKATRIVLKEATEWRLLSLLLERPRPGWHPEVEALAKEVEDSLLREAATLSRMASEEAYLAWLGPGGKLSPREVAYASLEDPGHLLADVMAFYHAFAFTPQAEDPPDHIAVEAGFMGYLALKEAYAQSVGNTEAVEITHAARDRFLEAHLGRLIRGLAENWRGQAELATCENEHGPQQDPGMVAAQRSSGGPAYLTKTVEALLRQEESIS